MIGYINKEFKQNKLKEKFIESKILILDMVGLGSGYSINVNMSIGKPKWVIVNGGHGQDGNPFLGHLFGEADFAGGRGSAGEMGIIKMNNSYPLNNLDIVLGYNGQYNGCDGGDSIFMGHRFKGGLRGGDGSQGQGGEDAPQWNKSQIININCTKTEALAIYEKMKKKYKNNGAHSSLCLIYDESVLD